MKAMQAWQVAETGGIASLRLVDVPLPEPGAGQALVRVDAAALNFSDLLMLRGQYQVRPPLPFIAGQEVAGTVVAAGEGSVLQVGTRVASKVEWGGFASHVCVADKMAIALPDGMSSADAATLPVVWPTAWIALHDRAALKAGETVLVHAAAGGVGLACLQLARAAGARPVALTGDESKFDACRKAGADEVMTYADDWVGSLRKRGGADVVVDSVGGKATADSLHALARHARLLLVGFSSGTIPGIPANRLLLKSASAMGVYWSHDWSLPQVERAVQGVLELHGKGAIRVEATRRHSWQNLPEALQELQERRTTGKTVIIADKEFRA